MPKLSREEHKARHVELHRALDELLANYITHVNRLPSRTTMIEFMDWSAAQCIDPTERE